MVSNGDDGGDGDDDDGDCYRHVGGDCCGIDDDGDGGGDFGRVYVDGSGNDGVIIWV